MVNNRGRHPNYFLGIDIGSYECKLALAQIESWEGQALEIVDVQQFKTQGSVERGSIVNIDALTEKIAEHLHPMLEPYSKDQIYTTCSIKNKGIRARINTAVNPFSKRMREVRRKDLDVAHDMASNAPLESGSEYLHIMTRHYRVDNRTPRKNPEGDIGSSVEAEVFLVSSKLEEIVKYKKCSEKLECPFDYLCTVPIATGEHVLTKEEKEDGVLLIDIGAQSTAAAVYELGSPKSLVVVPLGVDDITRDICKQFYLPHELGEIVTLSFSCVDPMYLSEFQTVESLSGEEGKIKELRPEQIYKISFARMLEILQYLYRSLNIVKDTSAYPVVITGGGARIRGLVSMIEKLTRTRVRLMQPGNWGGPIQTYRSPNFSTAIGLCAVGMKHYHARVFEGNAKLSFSENTPIGKENTKKEQWFSRLGAKIRSFFSLGDVD